MKKPTHTITHTSVARRRRRRQRRWQQVVEASRGRLVISLPLPAASIVPLFSLSPHVGGFPISLSPLPEEYPTQLARELPPSTSTVRHQCDTRSRTKRRTTARYCKPVWRAKGQENAMEDERVRGVERKGRMYVRTIGRASSRRGDRRAETVRRFVTVTRALASSGERVCTRK